MSSKLLADHRIKSSEVTFVVQGPIFRSGNINVTNRVTSSIRRFFPGSTVIVSTWFGEDCEGLVCDLLLQSSPPAHFEFDTNQPGVRNNVNLQIESSRQGLARVETPYAVKVRSDLIFSSGRLLNHLAFVTQLPARDFASRLLVLDHLTVDPRKMFKLLHHPCDWMTAGRTEDVLRLWDRSLMGQKDADFFSGRENGDHVRARLRPEAWIWCDLMGSVGHIVPRDTLDVSEELLEASIESFSSNLLPIGAKQISINSPKNHIGFDLGKVVSSYTIVELKSDLRNKGESLPRLLPSTNVTFLILRAWALLLGLKNRVAHFWRD